MLIPRSWAKAEGECKAPDNRQLKFAVWGWGSDNASAKNEAASRLQRLLERVRRGEPLPRGYGYGNRPLREEILESFGDGVSEQPAAVLTRNRYGAVVLNTSRLLFLDIDVPAESLFQRLRRLFSGNRQKPGEAVLTRLRETIRRNGRGTFRVYQTAAGFRAIAVDREYDPAGRDAQELMKQTGTDPAFTRLCAAQRSFRARLTPKPWRCGSPLPPGQYPFPDEIARGRYSDWIAAYEKRATGYATCRYLETIGSGRPTGQGDRLVALHDRLTRCGESLPLA